MFYDGVCWLQVSSIRRLGLRRGVQLIDGMASLSRLEVLPLHIIQYPEALFGDRINRIYIYCRVLLKSNHIGTFPYSRLHFDNVQAKIHSL